MVEVVKKRSNETPRIQYFAEKRSHTQQYRDMLSTIKSRR
jgi:hypothetical protein